MRSTLHLLLSSVILLWSVDAMAEDEISLLTLDKICTDTDARNQAACVNMLGDRRESTQNFFRERQISAKCGAARNQRQWGGFSAGRPESSSIRVPAF